MRVMLDLNVVLDVIQKREPHFQASAHVLDLVARGEVSGYFPSHGITTIHYIVSKFAGRETGDRAADWLLSRLTVAPAGTEHFLRARALPLADFEDAVVAALAETCLCDYVVSRNVRDFEGAPVPALTPAEFLAELGRQAPH